MESPLVEHLARIIPPSAKRVVLADVFGAAEIRRIAAKYRRINPYAQIICLSKAQLADSSVDHSSIAGADCLLLTAIRSDSSSEAILPRLAPCLSPQGIFVAAIDEWSRDLESLLANAHLEVFRTDRIGSDRFENREVRVPSRNLVVRAAHAAVQAATIAIHTHLQAPLCCAHVRVMQPNQFTETIPGVSHSVTTLKGRLRITDSPQKVFIWQRTFFETAAEKSQQRELIRHGFLTVAECDDHPLRYHRYRATNGLFFRACHCVQTSTASLADCLRQFNPHVAVFQNQVAELPEPKPQNARRPRIFFGAINRHLDWENVLPEINRLIHDLGRAALSFDVVHDRPFFEALETDRKTRLHHFANTSVTWKYFGSVTSDSCHCVHIRATMRSPT